ncbi:MAG: hypothetical protein QNJ53_00310, partial [Pleurocapsa sp. MO_192.B19]|nr:hypothetical protein [Pleurocapsa sp. MO_192.B19]
TLEQSLAAVFEQIPSELMPANTDSSSKQSALEIYRQAQQALQRGDWVEYGRYQQQLEDILQRLN